MGTYFYACSYPLEAGAVLRPGNWGRIVRKYNTRGFGNTWILFREEVFERIRRDEFPGKPSRFDSIFLCETEDDLRQFLKGTNRHLDLVYSVDLVDEDQPRHRACLTLLDFSAQESMASLEEKARLYWRGDEIRKPELVTTSRIRILAQKPVEPTGAADAGSPHR
jgi:hypothetical protein